MNLITQINAILILLSANDISKDEALEEIALILENYGIDYEN